MDWLLGQDKSQAYQEWSQLLSYIQSNIPNQRWVLKAPSHTASLNDLVRALPNSQLVQIHRHPYQASNSLNSFLREFHKMTCASSDIPRMSRFTLDWMENYIQLNKTWRKTNPGYIFDVSYERLIAEPIETVKSIYHHFGLEWRVIDEERIGAFIKKNPKGRYGIHHYTGSDFAITKHEVTERFDSYIREFELGR